MAPPTFPLATRRLAAACCASLLLTAGLASAQGAPPQGAPAPSSPAAPAAPSAAGSSQPAAPPPDGGGAGDAVDLTPGAAPAAAPPADPGDNPYIPVYPERRSGFLIGASGGLAVTSASGTRIKFSLRDQVADPGVAIGYGGLIYIGGVLTDWFSFHLGGGGSTATKSGLSISGTNFILGVETWPLFYRGGALQNLGVGLDFGTGSASIVNKNNEVDIRAQGSGFSMIRFSTFYELAPLKGLNFGPAVAYEYRTTDTYDEHLFTLGGRIAFHTGP